MFMNKTFIMTYQTPLDGNVVTMLWRYHDSEAGGRRYK